MYKSKNTIAITIISVLMSITILTTTLVYAWYSRTILTSAEIAISLSVAEYNSQYDAESGNSPYNNLTIDGSKFSIATSIENEYTAKDKFYKITITNTSDKTVFASLQYATTTPEQPEEINQSTDPLAIQEIPMRNLILYKMLVGEVYSSSSSSYPPNQILPSDQAWNNSSFIPFDFSTQDNPNYVANRSFGEDIDYMLFGANGTQTIEPEEGTSALQEENSLPSKLAPNESVDIYFAFTINITVALEELKKYTTSSSFKFQCNIDLTAYANTSDFSFPSETVI
jgi:hypothetical protein